MLQALRSCLAMAVASAIVADAAPVTAQPSVVVTIAPIHSLVAGVMRGVGEPKLLVRATASPHTFALRPSDAAVLADADIVIRVSEALEPFTRRLMPTLPRAVEAVTLVDSPGLVLHPVRSGDGFEAHDHGHRRGKGRGHDHARDVDGHIWLDPANAKAIVEAVVAALSRKVPEHAARFRSNGEDLRRRLDALSLELEASLAPVKGRPYVVLHDAYQYLERRYGLTPVGSITISPEIPPSARRLNALRNTVRRTGAVCMMSEPQIDNRLIGSIADGVAVRMGVLDPLGASLSPGPDLYFELMRNLAGALSECLTDAT